MTAYGISCLEYGNPTGNAHRAAVTIASMESGARTRLASVGVVLAFAVVVTGVLAAVGEGRPDTAAVGSPERGRTAYLSRGCGGCHDVSPVGNEQPSGPRLERRSLERNAAASGKGLGPYVLESIVAPRAFAVPGYVSGAMPSYAQLSKRELDDLVSYVIGEPFGSAPVARIPRRPLAACEASQACRKTVNRWRQDVGLPAAAVPGAKIVAITDCRSCHVYAGTGARRSSAPDLTRQASRKRSVAWLVRKLRCPTCSRPASGMPSYAALGDANLRRVALFLRASKGTRR